MGMRNNKRRNVLVQVRVNFSQSETSLVLRGGVKFGAPTGKGFIRETILRIVHILCDKKEDSWYISGKEKTVKIFLKNYISPQSIWMKLCDSIRKGCVFLLNLFRWSLENLTEFYEINIKFELYQIIEILEVLWCNLS